MNDEVDNQNSHFMKKEKRGNERMLVNIEEMLVKCQIDININQNGLCNFYKMYQLNILGQPGWSSCPGRVGHPVRAELVILSGQSWSSRPIK